MPILKVLKNHVSNVLHNPSDIENFHQGLLSVLPKYTPKNQVAQLLHDHYQQTDPTSAIGISREILSQLAQAQKANQFGLYLQSLIHTSHSTSPSTHDWMVMLDVIQSCLLETLGTQSQDIDSYKNLHHALQEFFLEVKNHWSFDSFPPIDRLSLNHSLLDFSPSGILIVDHELKITEWNQVMESWYGYQKENVLGTQLSVIFPYLDYTEGRLLFLSVLEGKPAHIPVRKFAKREGYYKANLIPLFDHAESIIGILGMFHDISDTMTDAWQPETSIEMPEQNDFQDTQLLKRLNRELEYQVHKRTKELAASEEEIRQMLDKTIELNDILAARENWLQNIIMQSPISTIITDHEGKVIQYNKRYRQLFQQFAMDKGENLLNALSENIKDIHYQTILKVYQQGTIYKFEEEEIVIEGKKVPMIVTVYPIKDVLGNVSHVVFQHEDISEQRKAEIALLHNEERLRLLTDALPVFISYIDRDYRYRFVNQAYASWFQRAKSDITDQKIIDIVGEKAFNNIYPYLEQAMNGKAADFELHQDYGHMGQRYLNAVLVPHFEDQEIKGVYFLATDIYKQKQIEKTLKKLYREASLRNKELNRINTDLDSFVYIASHDLKAPIGNLIGLVELLSESLSFSDGQAIRLVQMMELSINKLQRTIGDLIEITKLQKDIESQQVERINLQQLVSEVKEDLNNLIRESKVEFTESFEIDETDYPRIHLRSILYNLLSNAIKYRSPARPVKVSLTTRLNGKRHQIIVTDNGLGMTPAQQKKLFQMFKRMHHHVEGTGIGLFTIKKIIENYHGKIMVESKPDEGTTFTVTL